MSPSLVLPEIAAVHDEMVALRRHSRPPGAGLPQEFATSDLVAQRLAEWGYRVTRGVGQTGVVATLQRGPGNRSASAPTWTPCRLPKRPACRTPAPIQGDALRHDGHTAMLLAAARYLARQPNFSGTLHLIFQPAEGGGGARVMIEDGLFERFPATRCSPCTTCPASPAGHRFASGPFMCSADTVHITLHGHGAPRRGAAEHRRSGGGLRAIVMSCKPSWRAISIRRKRRSPGAGRNHPARNRAGARGGAGMGRRNGVIPTLRLVHRQRRFRLYAGEAQQQLSPSLDRQRPRHAGQFLHNPGYDFNDDSLSLGATYWVKLVERFLLALRFNRQR